MERLSDRAIEIINELHTERLDYNSEYLPLIDAAQKLNDIETVMGDYDLDRLRELVQADREGRCSAHSFGVDKLAWTISYGAVTAEVVTGVYLSKTLEGIEVLYTTSCGDGLIGEFYERDIGKTVFRTRQEAESALKAVKERENDG